MYDLYYWPTPNGKKIAIMLEEVEAPYTVFPVDIGKGDQFKPDFLKISPNNRIPALVDNAPADGGEPLGIFESGAILEYLAMKHGILLPTETRARIEVMQWLFWQMGGLGPMAGQAHHFRKFAPEQVPYAIDRYTKETARLYGVMDKRLADRDYLAGAYSIADISSWTWVSRFEWQGQDLNDFPNLKRWYDTIAARPAVAKGFIVGDDLRK
ncbi:MAG: glutathione S-transferase N-terminal domain-containing protein [Rhodospirillum sp.]|nr:glutathione S-transferase N-terminal domain-containing protein [Rhodospirillum sp.]MCF8492098.1 glutathione S-transferase N-terminal domain-containing protein [Rhodospirillum sp.]MCF8502080.1 glutathione S-transferase N-terminal domain-containing protein [Rhodospirillum sp.]